LSIYLTSKRKTGYRMSSQADPSWCKATLEDKAVATFRWTIPNFKNRPEKYTEKLESTCFYVHGPGDLKTKWQLEIYPKGKEGYRNGFIPVCLNYEGPANATAEFKVDMDIIFNLGSKQSFITGVTGGFETSGVGSVWGIIIADKLYRFLGPLQDGNLTIECMVTVVQPEKTLSGSEDSENTDLSIHCQKQLGEHLGKVFSDKEFTDIKIKCEGQSFDCHIAILAARSPVFKAMFQSNMKEKETQKVAIDDFTPNVVAEMLNFMYTGTVSSHDAIGEIATDLLRAADKYQVDLLKNVCEDRLCSTVEVTNCVDYLVLGDMYQTLKLKRKAVETIAENVDSIMDSDVFKDLFKQNPGLAWEVTKALNKK